MVLLIDADADFRAALAANLLDDGYQVAEFARTAEVPLHRLEQLTMLILDYQVAGEDGLAFADRFHATHPGVPVVMTSAYCSTHLESEVAARPFMTLRRKPIDYEELAVLLPAPPAV